MTWEPLQRSTPYAYGTANEIELPENESQWMNDTYVVMKRLMPADDDQTPPMIYLSIRRQDRGTAHDWRDFQRIKNQLAGPEWEAMEIYPAESRLVDGANQYHLWCFDFRLGIGFNKRVVADPEMSERMSHGSVQRPFEDVDLQYGGESTWEEIHADNPPDRMVES